MTASRICGRPRIPRRLSLELSTLGEGFQHHRRTVSQGKCFPLALTEDCFEIPFSHTVIGHSNLVDAWPPRISHSIHLSLADWLQAHVGLANQLVSPLLTFRIDGLITWISPSWTLTACPLFCDALSVSHGFVPETNPRIAMLVLDFARNKSQVCSASKLLRRVNCPCEENKSCLRR